jgi:hypothetical protein
LTGAGIGLFANSRSPGQPLAPPGLRSFRIVYAGATGVRLVPLNGGPVDRPITTPAGPLLETDHGVVLIHEGEAYLLTSPFGRIPLLLARADDLFPMAWPGMVGADRHLGGAATGALYLDLEPPTAPASPEWVLPPGYQPVSQFLAVGPDGVLRMWQPGPGGTAYLGPTLGRADAVLAAAGNEVAWLADRGCAPDGECPLEVSNLAPAAGTPATATIAPPSGRRGFAPGAALSPDGQYLAVFVPGPHPGGAQLAIVDTATRQVTLVAGGAVPTAKAGPGGSAQWTPDGSYVLFSGAHGPMHAYHLGDARAVTLGVPGSDSFAITP